MEKKDHPLVSVVIPCYNQAIYLSEALDSLLQELNICVKKMQVRHLQEIWELNMQKGNLFYHLMPMI